MEGNKREEGRHEEKKAERDRRRRTMEGKKGGMPPVQHFWCQKPLGKEEGPQRVKWKETDTSS